MKQRSRVHFHGGTCETIAEVYLYDRSELAPGQSALAQLRLQEEVLVLPGDRFIVRQFSPVTTIGGGVVLDPAARRPTIRDSGRAGFLQTLERGEQAAMLDAMTERAVLGLRFEDIVARTGWREGEILSIAKKLADTGLAKCVSTVTREDLRSSLGRRVRPETFRTALDDLLAQKKLETQGEIVKRAGSSINLEPEEARAKEQIETAFAAAGLAVPAVKEVLSKLPVEAKRAEKILQILLRDKSLIRVTPELIFHRDALAQLRGRLSAFKKTKGERISVPVFKELTGITRKYAIPLLEYLDRERVTRRAGDERVIL